MINNYLTGYDYRLPSEFNEVVISQINATSFSSGRLSLDRLSPYFPARSDEKVMREDIKSAIISINTLLDDFGPLSEKSNVSLFVSNGAFIDNPQKHLERVTNVYSTFGLEMTNEEKIRKIYQACPPLIALEALTNSTMSFIAQYTGLKSHNITFGNTSISGFHAISEAIMSLKNKGRKQSVVCGSNCGGIYSYLSNSSITETSENWKESAAVGSLLLSHEEKCPDNALCIISILKENKGIPDLETKNFERNWQNIIPDEKADMIIFSGSFTSEEYEKDLNYCAPLSSHTYSFFPEYGNLGASNIPIGICKGVEFLQKGYSTVDIIDRDIYGRESLIRVEKC